MMHSVVENILKSTQARLDFLDSKPMDQIDKPRDLIKSAQSLKSRGIDPIIAEIKPRILGRSLDPDEVSCRVKLYEKMGACAISVLTQPTYFLGSPENARIARESTHLPVLRKDFILDERQLSEVRSDLVLLIAAFSKPLDELIEAARYQGMEPLVEVHTEDELELALSTDAKIVGINNRDLRTLEIDLQNFERLGPLAKSAGVFVVAESGVETREDVYKMMNTGADAILVGTSLMNVPAKLLKLNGKAVI
ncbi:MAG: indole-3-glycerol-phosphate synthase [Methanotrichaceae archaeon]